MIRRRSHRSRSWLALVVVVSVSAPGCALKRYYENKRAAAQERVNEGRKSAGSDVLPGPKIGNPVDPVKAAGHLADSELPANAARAGKAIGALAPAVTPVAAAAIAGASSATGGAPQAPAQPPLSNPMNDLALNAYKEGLAHVASGDDVAALQSFETAQNLSKDPRVLKDRGLCEQRLHRPKDAVKHLRLYLQELKGQLSPEEERQVAAVVASECMLIEPIDALNDAEKEDYEIARDRFAKGDFANARTKYGEVYEKFRDPRQLYNVALCDFKLRHFATALRMLEQYEKESKGKLKDDKARELEDYLLQAGKLVARVSLVVDPPGASVRIDDGHSAAILVGQPLLVDLGWHQVHLTKKGYQERVIEQEFTSEPAQIAVRLLAVNLLAIDTRGKGGIIKVDGEIKGTSHWEDYVLLGVHQIDVVWTDSPSFHETVTVDAEHPTEIRAEPKERFWGLRTWLVIGGAAVLAGTAALYFGLRSPGTTPPEVGTLSPGTVQLP
jgi:tetratricopeptide (TPR) repeat protein